MGKWYFVTNYSVTNRDGYAEYPKLVGATQEGLCRRIIAGPGEVIEGEPLDRTVVLEFESRDDFEKWYYSPEYQEILPLRTENSQGWAILIEEFG